MHRAFSKLPVAYAACSFQSLILSHLSSINLDLRGRQVPSLSLNIDCSNV